MFLRIVLMLAFAMAFVHFLQGGARTFERAGNSEGSGAVLGQLSFITGALIAMFSGVYYRVGLRNEIAATVILIVGVGLYEWARQTIVGRRFYVGFTEAVPEEVCADGPYAHIRHPIYMGYIITFFALFVAFPGIVTGVALALNVVLFVRMAFDDERVLANSALATSYDAYARTVGRFFPRLSKPPGD